MEWLQNMDWLQLLRCFCTGGIICVIGQILIDKTKLTPARILVAFVTIGCILGGLGIYQYLVDFAGAGATVPLTGFGYNLAKGAIKGVKEYGLIGAFTGGVTASADGIHLSSVKFGINKNSLNVLETSSNIFAILLSFFCFIYNIIYMIPTICC